MYKIVGSILFWLISVSAIAQVQLTLTDKVTGESLPGASLHIRKAGQPDQAVAVSDEDGVIGFIPARYPVTLIISSIGYNKHELSVTEAGTYKIELTPDVNQLDQVVVTGQFEPQSVRQSVYQVRTISNERIMLRSPVNVQGALSTELGIRFSNDLTLGTADISLMGMSGRNVKILLDGVPLLDRGDTRESLNQIDINTIDRIEIVDGPMSVIYGTDALAGVINIITKKTKENSLLVEARVHEETAGKEYEAFSGKGVHNESVNVNWASKKLYAGAGVTRNAFGGWNEGRAVYVTNPFGDGEWHPKDQWLMNTTLGYRTDALNIWYRLNYLKETISPLGNASVSTQTVFTDQDYITNRFNHQLQADWTISDRWSFNGSATFQDLSRKTVTTNYDKTTGRETLSLEEGSQSEAMINMAMVRGFFLYKLSPVISVQPGFEANFSTGSGDRIDRERSINDYAAFVSVEYKPTPNINIRPGARFIYNSVYDAPPVTPSLNARFTLGKSFDLRVAYARGFRAPALRELYFYFYDANHSLEGNPDLKAEFSNSYSSSLTWNVTQQRPLKVKSTLVGFYNVFDNLISLVQYQNSVVFKYDNVYKYKTTGGTLENNFYWKNLSVTLGGSYIGNYNDLTEEDDSLPEFTWNTEINAVTSYHFQKVKNTVGLYYKYTGMRQSYFTDGTDVHLGEVEGFHMMDVSTSQVLLRNLTFTLGVKNLLDVQQLTNSVQNTGAHTSSEGTVSMSYGRSYFATLLVRFSK
jgi:outer membrane receptor for ferrienterochelin and colicins